MALKKNGRYPGPGYDEQGPGVPVPPKKKASTKYSPAPMSAAAKAKAAAAGKATGAKTKPKSTAGKVAGALVNTLTKQNRPTRQLMNNGKVFTPEQKAYLKKMLSQSGRLDK